MHLFVAFELEGAAAEMGQLMVVQHAQGMKELAADVASGFE